MLAGTRTSPLNALRRAVFTVLLLGGCLDQGEPAGPNLSWTSDIGADDAGAENDEGSEDSEDEGNDDGKDPDESETPTPGDKKMVTDCLAEQVVALRPRLNICRSCHMLKLQAEDSEFLLTKDASQDAANLLLAFDKVGQDLIRMPAEEGGLKHKGGKRLTQGTAIYDAWKEMMAALKDPDSCSDLSN